jgi:hypothetical protein
MAVHVDGDVARKKRAYGRIGALRVRRREATGGGAGGAGKQRATRECGAFGHAALPGGPSNITAGRG